MALGDSADRHADGEAEQDRRPRRSSAGRVEVQLVTAQGRAEGWTVVLCASSACRTALRASLMSSLRAAVRSSMHGVLVTSECLLGPLACSTRERGPLVLVQPCDQHRTPIGCAVLVGPLLAGSDVTTVEAWLRGGLLDPALLPGHLRTAHRAVYAAVRN